MSKLLDMRKGVCPICERREILTSILAVPTGQGLDPVPVQPAWTDEATVVNERREVVGKQPLIKGHSGLESYICRLCGYTQLFAIEPQEIAVDGSAVRLISSEPSDDEPYR